MARYQFFQEIVTTITSSQNNDSVFEMRCSSIEELMFPETEITSIDGESFKCFTNLKKLSFTIGLLSLVTLSLLGADVETSLADYQHQS